MRNNTCHESQNLVVLSAADWDSMEHLLKSTISERGRDGDAATITLLSPSAQSTIAVKVEFMD